MVVSPRARGDGETRQQRYCPVDACFSERGGKSVPACPLGHQARELQKPCWPRLVRPGLQSKSSKRNNGWLKLRDSGFHVRLSETMEWLARPDQQDHFPICHGYGESISGCPWGLLEGLCDPSTKGSQNVCPRSCLRYACHNASHAIKRV